VTVAIIAYYREFLEECIASVLAQTYRDIKVVVYDDCSPEDLASAVSEFGDGRLSYVRNRRNLGTFGNTNQAIDLCDSEYINVFHGDDVMFPRMIEKLVRALDGHPTAGLAASSRICALGSRLGVAAPLFAGGTLFKKDELIRATNRRGRNYVVCPSMTFRKKNIDKLGIRFRPEAGPAADMFLSLEANHKGMDVYCVRRPLLGTRHHGKRWTTLAGVENWQTSLKKLDDYLTGISLGFGIDGIREYMAKMDLSMYISGLRDDEDLSAAAARRRDYLGAVIGWRMTDRVFDDAVAIGFLNRYGTSGVAMEKGVRIPLARKIKWFINHRA
jgi:glycosyltransferase involved in cell wall biosynthesis